MTRSRLATTAVDLLRHLCVGALVSSPFVCTDPDLLPPVSRPWTVDPAWTTEPARPVGTHR